MSYDDAFFESSQWIKEWYNYLGYDYVDYDEYYQNCAVDFYSLKKQGCNVAKCLQDTKKRYFDILVNMAKDFRLESKLFTGFVEDFAPTYRIVNWKYSIFMPYELESVCDMIVMGYNNKEISNFMHFSEERLTECIEEIKNMYRESSYLELKKQRKDRMNEKTTTV